LSADASRVARHPRRTKPHREAHASQTGRFFAALGSCAVVKLLASKNSEPLLEY